MSTPSLSMFSEFEKQMALQDVYNVVTSSQLKIRIFGLQQKITKDKYGSIIARESEYVEVSAFPIQYSPTAKELEAIGVLDRMDVTAYCSSKELKDLGLIADYGYSKKDNLSIIDTTIVDKWNNEYRVATIQNYSAFMDSYLYVVFGLLRR